MPQSNWLEYLQLKNRERERERERETNVKIIPTLEKA